MKKQECQIIIYPDQHSLITLPDGCCDDAYGDDICNDDFSLGPRFHIVVPGIGEWRLRFVSAIDYYEAKTDDSFDWLSWHYEGLLFAKEIKRLLPLSFKLAYIPPYEDRSQILDRYIEITDDIDKLIDRLSKDAVLAQNLSYKDNVSYQTDRQSENMSITARVGNVQKNFDLPDKQISDFRNWLIRIIRDEDDVVSIALPSVQLTFFRQRIGSHTDMGQFWIERNHDIPEIAAYVNVKEFVKGIYLSLMSSYGFGIYPDVEYNPTSKEKDEFWKPYNALKSIEIESYIFGITQRIENTTPQVRETYVIFPDSDCLFWDTMGAGCGDSKGLETDSGAIHLIVDGLKEWGDMYDNDQPIENFSVYWKTGWNIALKVRKLLPEHIDLYYMCYDPSKPDECRKYACEYPKVIVPYTREIYSHFPTTEARSLYDWNRYRMSAAYKYVIDCIPILSAYHDKGDTYARDSYLSGTAIAKELLQESAGNGEEISMEVALEHYLAKLDAEIEPGLRKIASEAFTTGFKWHMEYGQHLFMDPLATLMLENQANTIIRNAAPERQWDDRPGNGPTSGFKGYYKFHFCECETPIKIGDKVILRAHENPGWERFCPFIVKAITDRYVVVNTDWCVLRKSDLWDIELVEVSR